MRKNKYSSVVLWILSIIGIIIIALGIAFSQERTTTIEETKCLVFERVENRILEDSTVTIFLRNCGEETISNITVILTYGEETQVKYISNILPNEIKFIKFTVFAEIGERKIVNVYAYSRSINIRYDFYIEKPTYLQMLKLEIKNKRLIKEQWNEVYLIIKNKDMKTFKNLDFFIEFPANTIVVYETTKLSFYPLQTKAIRLRIFVSEDYKEKEALFRIKIGEMEFVEEFTIEERIRIDWKKWLNIAIIFAIILSAIILVYREIEKRDKRKKTIER